MDPVLDFFVDNPDLINTLKAEFYNNPDLVLQNPSKSLYDRLIGNYRHNDTPTGPHNEFWEQHVDLYNYLDSVTYPRDPNYVINCTWMRYYTKGCFSAFHQDQHLLLGHVVNQTTNIILIDRSDDLVGGVTVIAGDSFEFDRDDPNKPGQLRERLITKFMDKPGDAVAWNEKVVHGISRIERGSRLVFMVSKVPKSLYTSEDN